ncbi:HD domain-containing protein [Gaoshiqia sediminis]|uniref:HD domain-containing protein n=1 Tax=Gaoshiqia sediminis TaxID=2986998 RepID=A0AA41Y7T0_9BACT|nr:HD domain-containing protein [Gaoshiqia sediminis]MCW0482458.1 HD domain-containing protein [Gaoshiqia sediminis]
MKKLFYIQETAMYVRLKFEKESSGHDWWHIHRVWQLAVKIAKKEKANLFLVEMAALLHDMDDWKLGPNGQDEPRAVCWMKKLGLPEKEIEQIWQIISEVSFKGAGVDTTPTTLEAGVVQDADRLDAIGAIGIARTFTYGGYNNRLIYDPGIDPESHRSFAAYQKTSAPTINHFYEKLLLLKDRMNTETGRKMADARHAFMEQYLAQFFHEWNLN